MDRGRARNLDVMRNLDYQCEITHTFRLLDGVELLDGLGCGVEGLSPVVADLSSSMTVSYIYQH
jgi:hypothetical protein